MVINDLLSDQKLTSSTRFVAIYFHMGQYNEDDNISDDLNGFDCPFDDSPVLYANDRESIEAEIVKGFEGERGDNFHGLYPDVICDRNGKILTRVYRAITEDADFDPDTTMYSFGRENLTTFWTREKWRWFPEERKKTENPQLEFNF